MGMLATISKVEENYLLERKNYKKKFKKNSRKIPDQLVGFHCTSVYFLAARFLAFS